MKSKILANAIGILPKNMKFDDNGRRDQWILEF